MVIKTEEKEEKSSDHVRNLDKKIVKAIRMAVIVKAGNCHFCMIFTRFAGLQNCIGIF